MWMGETEKRLNGLFETARADNVPAIVFIDDIDAIGAKRSDIQSACVRRSVTQLLTEMDGISSHNDQLLVMGTTNAPWMSIQRFAGLADSTGYCSCPRRIAPPEPKYSDFTPADGRSIRGFRWDDIARDCEHFSRGRPRVADRSRLRCCLGEAIKLGRARDVSLADFRRSLKKMRSSTVEWLRRAKNYVTYANQDGFYNELSQYIASAKL